MMNALNSNNNSCTLAATDQVMATLTGTKGILASVNKCNFTSINDVVRFVMAIAGRFAGLATLNIRNRTQGWSLNMALLAPAQPLSARRPAPAARPQAARQLAFNW